MLWGWVWATQSCVGYGEDMMGAPEQGEKEEPNNGERLP